MQNPIARNYPIAVRVKLAAALKIPMFPDGSTRVKSVAREGGATLTRREGANGGPAIDDLSVRPIVFEAA